MKVYVWGLWDQNVAINQIVEAGKTLCWSTKELGKKEQQFHSTLEGDDVMLESLYTTIDTTDVIVTYNGKKFDLPTVYQEFAIRDMKPPMPSHHIDLYQVVRKNFRLPSYKLDYVAKVFGIGRKMRHKGMDLWTECMNGDEKAWKIMEAYNKQDVKLLAKLYKVLLPWIQNHPNHALYSETGTDRPRCTNCNSTKVHSHGTTKTKTGVYKRYRCESCGKPLRGRMTQVPKENRENILVSI